MTTTDGDARSAAPDLDEAAALAPAAALFRGLGDPSRLAILRHLALGDHRVRDLTEEEVTRLRNWIDANVKVEGDLRRDVSQDIKRKMEIGSYQGIRHRRGLPVHGQRTHTNARTRKGPKKTVGRGKKAK